MAHVRLVLPKPGWFLVDTRCDVLFDGRRVYEGSFMSGFDIVVDCEPGHHSLQTFLHLGPVARTKSYELDVSGDVEVRLSYSRFWGNFTSRLSVSG